MIVVVIRILLLLLRRAGLKVPALPSLRLRPTLIERALRASYHRDGSPPEESRWQQGQ